VTNKIKNFSYTKYSKRLLKLNAPKLKKMTPKKIVNLTVIGVDLKSSIKQITESAATERGIVIYEREKVYG